MTYPDGEVIDLLTEGTIDVVGRIAWSSNATFLADVSRSDGSPGTATDAPVRTLQAIYKPLQGERPLHDFPEGIFRREVAAYELARSLGWDLVPETVVVDGPLGIGSLQRLVDVDYADHYFTMFETDDAEIRSQLRRICCLDLLANNTDRKSGHCLLDADGHVWAIDNALSFHAEFKLRTVIWDFAGEPIATALLDDIVAWLDRGMSEKLVDLLDPFERDALLTRARGVITDGRFPHDPTGRRYPWPLV